MSWNSTHTAIASMAAVVIAGMHYGIELIALAPILGPLGAYIVLRERNRVNK